jgi:hypothetical protein
MPTFGAMFRLSSQALFFKVITEKTDKSQAVADVESHPSKNEGWAPGRDD